MQSNQNSIMTPHEPIVQIQQFSAFLHSYIIHISTHSLPSHLFIVIFTVLFFF